MGRPAKQPQPPRRQAPRGRLLPRRTGQRAGIARMRNRRRGRPSLIVSGGGDGGCPSGRNPCGSRIPRYQGQVLRSDAEAASVRLCSQPPDVPPAIPLASSYSRAKSIPASCPNRLAGGLLQLCEGLVGGGEKLSEAGMADLWHRRPGSRRRQGHGSQGARASPGVTPTPAQPFSPSPAGGSRRLDWT